MNDLDRYIQERSNESPEFKAAFEEESALLELIRARNSAKLSQKEVADALNLSQPYIAQVERGSKPMSLKLMIRYAHAVGASVKVISPPKTKPKAKTKTRNHA